MITVEELTTATPGASDKDRPAWLAERRTGATATEIRDLYMGKLTVSKLVARKLGREKDSFAGNEYTRWGVEREPVIAAEVERRYGILPESRVFHAADEPRFLASPDGLGCDFDGRTVLAEIKTAGRDVAPGTPNFNATGYLAQCVWAMRVMGARRCLFAWERRIEVAPGKFEPGELRMEWIDYDQLLATRLERLATEFLAALDAAAAEPWEEPAIDEKLDTDAVNYLRGLGLQKEGEELKETSYRAIFDRLDAAGVQVLQESPLARVSFSPAVEEERPVVATDVTAARKAAPAGLYERLEQAEDDARQAGEALARERAAVAVHEAGFVRQTGVERVVVKKAALRVTAGKQTKKETGK